MKSILAVAVFCIHITTAMGYNIYITRSDELWDAEPEQQITFKEWKELVDSTPSLRLDGYAEAGSGEDKIRINQEGLTACLNKEGEIIGWFTYSEGVISCDGPNDETIKEMYRIAKKLNADLMGAEGEYYGPDAEVIKNEN
ncbi:hypothetical protein [Pelagicoccus albus]|uniref:Uncharacterized protein n=1 Tax=Pelagicoccus albus TaxID=415222 RepID=A0A7X1B606_9BACT|nr:hypothetical protein [Pelagicoccus albus]MBC2606308.1 hypothetical protein [Pelagicoccus albus]